ncbi:hypothetical protein TL18_05045 [Methanobrevibacter sp. YE315]|uniref:hypothetical protein n=1 Tax=Methanobrevibacter sp. YE315 TaxID=1609968 RepID=UPI000764D66C|nr:hypothetical protein [Methanobrevibacter sp. YE315]AMD17440.1 hypothetical protein TL18_05045 [Methanobrevibacter sp. YE315]
MSDLSELIQITKNIEKQNTEIIRLLKKIAGEEEEDKTILYKSAIDYTPDFGELYITPKDKPEGKSEQTKEIDNTFKIGTLLENTLDVGEVYFIDSGDIFKLTIKNNENIIDNLTGDGEPDSFYLQELIANESVKNNVSLEDNTVILSKEQSEDLPETLRICVEQGATKIHLPLSASTQLIRAPQILMNLIKFDFYKTEEQLLEGLF